MNFLSVLRKGLLFVALLITILWAIGQRMSGPLRADWTRGVRVAVVLLQTGPLPEGAEQELRSQIKSAEAWVAEQAAGYTKGGVKPFDFEVGGPYPLAELVPLPAPDDGFLERVRTSWKLWRFRKRMDTLAASTVAGADVQIYVVMEPPSGSGKDPLEFEGVAQEGRRWGLVRGELDARSAFDVSVALLHEVLHCVGATDKYDAHGHTIAPGGLVEPSSGLPQSRAELMVGEIALGPGRGRLPLSFAEVGVGPATALEIGWTK